jgi:hypothetical protein
MTLVGKIFTFLIFVMSLVFMAFAIAVYTTHRNWREAVENSTATADKPLGWKARLDQEKAKREQLQADVEDREKKLNIERLARNQALQALQSQLKVAQDSLAQEIAARKQQEQQLRENITIVQTNSENVARLTSEVNELRQGIRQAMLERDEQFKKTVALQDEVQQRKGEIVRIREREQQLAGQLALWEQVKVMQNLPAPETILATRPPAVRGDVRRITPDGKLLEISIGADDGLKAGHMLEVYRGGAYLGRAVVRRTEPDRGVAEVIPAPGNQEIRVGDRVMTKAQQVAAQ